MKKSLAFEIAKGLNTQFRHSDYRCKNCGNEITFGTHDHLWRHVLDDATHFPIQCPNSVAVAEPQITVVR